VSLTAVSAPCAPFALGGQASAVVGIAGQLIAANVVVGALCLSVAAWAEAASRAGAAAASSAVEELGGSRRADCRTAAAGQGSQTSVKV
jgi:hypothetical protein